MPKLAREVLIAGDQQEYAVLFSNRALLNVETWTGKSIIMIVSGFVDGKSGIREISRLLQAGMEEARRQSGEGGKAITHDDALSALDDIGTVRALNELQDALVNVLNHRNRDEKEETAPEEKNV